jgi:hypothetical protein
VPRGEDEGRRRRVEPGERLPVDRRGRARATVDPQVAGATSQRPALALVAADQEQAQRGVAPRELDESFEEQVEVLVALGVADEKQVRPFDAEGLLDERQASQPDAGGRSPRRRSDDFDPGVVSELAQNLTLGGVQRR